MQAKVSTFDKELIRSYIEQSPVMQKGISYYKHVNPSLTDAAAKECAIREAQEYCHRRWLSDSSGYLNEYRAFEEFTERVSKGSYFSIETYDAVKARENRTFKDVSVGFFATNWWKFAIAFVILIITLISYLYNLFN